MNTVNTWDFQRLLVGVLGVALALAGCMSSELSIGAKDPANPAAPVASLAPIGAALEPGFDPQSLEGSHSPSQAGPDPHAGHTGHGSPSSTTADEHSGHDHQSVQQNDSKPTPSVWTCPMHPEVRKPEPGKCPVCGMKLEPAAPPKPDGGKP